ncbi:LacI family DNA-binding transcriptional regulator [Limnohabitans sp.]|jgi:LacI family transcriptional regulator|uniref:LacI family DNA-binding transcriptional regulator n=1 Tax=Limnohabitans sp. TaxID=1907725 RepID=UPI0037BEEBCA
MKQSTTIADVARLAGVSTATVSRVLSKPGVVRSHTQEQVMAAVRQLDYQPVAAARALASGRTHTVGCVIPTLDHAIFARSTQAMQTTLAHAGYQLLVASHEYDPDTELELVRALQQRGVDALVLVGTDHAPRLWEALGLWPKPTLLTWSCDPRLPSLGFDNAGAARMATAHLLGLGHRKIAVISGFTAHNDRARSRIEGARQTLAQAGLSLPPARVTEQAFNLEGGRLGLRQLMSAEQPPSAIFCGNDLLAVGALLEAQRMGLKVPGNLSICGIDDLEIAQAINPGLTTVRLPTQDLGRMAALSMLSAISGEVIAAQSLLPFSLVVRGSTAVAGLAR